MGQKFDELETGKKKGSFFYQSQLITQVLAFGTQVEECNLIKNIEAQMDIQRSKDYFLKEVMLGFTLNPSIAPENSQLTKQKPSLSAKSGLVSDNNTSNFGLNPRQISMLK